MLDILVGEHSFVVQDVIDKDAVAQAVGVARLRLVVVAALQYLAALVDDPLVEVAQVVALPLVFVISRRELEYGVGVNQRLILQ